ncbi:MAG: radical SAM/SPASM domain-containing protein [Candidatus Nealsonbacteria bacterium]
MIEIFVVYHGKWSFFLPCKANEKLEILNRKINIPRVDYISFKQSSGTFFYPREKGSVFEEYYFIFQKEGSRFIISAPLIVDLEITTYCNLNCRHCYVNKENVQNLSLGQIQKLFREFKNIGVVGIQLLGGEPSLHPRIKDIITSAYKQGLKIEMVSNGNNSLRENCDKVSNKIDYLLISVDGNENTHDYIRNKKGAFHSALESIKFFSEKGVKTKAIMTLNRINSNQYREVATKVEESGAEGLVLKFMMPIGMGEKNLDMVLRSKERKKIYKKILQEKGSFEISDQMYNALEQKVNANFFGCPAGRFSIRISAKGDVYWCIYHKKILGNIGQESFKTIWEERIIKNNFYGATSCRYSYRCGGPCKLSKIWKKGEFKCPL